MTISITREYNPVSSAVAACIDALPLLSVALPFRFDNGSTITGLETSCTSCGKLLTSTSMKGKFELLADGTAASLNAYGICYDCRTITLIEAKFHDDGTALFKGPKGWIKCRWKERRPEGFQEAAARFIRLRWQQTLPPFLVFGAALVWFLVQS